VRQNHRIIKFDACDPALARDVRRRHIQVATQAGSRKLVFPSSAQYRFEAGATGSALHGSGRRIWPGLLDISQVVKPETILRWSLGFRDGAGNPE
jgi:hypothetical protein